MEQAGIADNDRVQNLLAVAAASPNETVTRQVHRVLQVAASQHSQYPFKTPNVRSLATVPGDCLYELNLGHILNSSSAFTLGENVLTRHMLITGETGAGKTTLIYNLMNELSTPFWAFDLKTDYRHRLQADPALVVLPWDRLQFNPLHPPPSVSPRRWAQVFHEVFGDAYDLLGPSQHYLLPHLLDLYRDYDVLEDTPDPETAFPTMQDLYEYLRKHGETGRITSNYKDRLTSRLRATLAATNHLFDAQTGEPFPELLKEGLDVVFELDGLAADHQDFIMEWLLVWLYTYQAAQQDRGDGLEHVLIMDEGKRAFSVYKERSDAKGLPTIDTVLAKLREFQIGVVVADQEPSKLTDSLLANTHTKVLFRIGDHDQFRRMAESMDLDRRQREFATDLGVGHAVIRSGVDAPVPVDLHDTAITKTVTDTELKSQMQETWTQLIPGSSPVTGSSKQAIEQASFSPEQAGSREKPVEEAVSDNAKELLRDIAHHPFKTHLERYELFSESSPSQGITAKNALEDAGLIREHTTVDESGKRKLLELTDHGRQYLEEQDVDISYRGRGGVVHRYWQHRIRDLFEENGYEARIESDDADVAVKANGGRIAVEVAMRDRDREIQHVADRLDTGFDGVITACRNPNVQTGLQEKLTDSAIPEDRVQLRLFRDFFSHDTLLS
ncbi:helicase HerA domain-containing protein [Natrinema salinisoli]|uniref:helicase HerA domain-containing protein n=1 Tax=Natrinema salinisoli TaxID=2878535 RepID=UPI001CF0B339|nr:DUF87 domain-containing protein [Natrinema salinisoli]